MPQETKHSAMCGNLPQFRSTALIAAGSNQYLGNNSPTSTLDRTLIAIKMLPEPIRGAIRGVSAYYETPCFPPGAGPDFVNAAFVWDCDLDAGGILEVLHQLERDAGRTREKRWGQRTLDLDLIAVNQTVLPDPQTQAHWMDQPLEVQMRDAPDTLILPHPRMHERGFVLAPLADVAPDWVHPVLNRSVRQMLDDLPPEALAGVKPLVNRPKQA